MGHWGYREELGNLEKDKGDMEKNSERVLGERER